MDCRIKKEVAEYRIVQYTVLDQENEAAPIDTNGTLAETISNYEGPSGVKPPDETSGQMTHGVRPDTVGYLVSNCPSSFTATLTQNFKVIIGNHSYDLTSHNAISMGRTSSGSKFVDITFTQ